MTQRSVSVLRQGEGDLSGGILSIHAGWIMTAGSSIDRAGYAVGIVGPMLGWIVGGQYLLYFYTEVLHLPAALAGLVFGVGMVWDAISDPLIGALADRTRSRWGRYRAWLLWGCVPYGLSIPLAFSSLVPTGGALALLVVIATNVIFRTLYSIVYMPYTAMLVAIAPGYDERTSYTSWKSAFVFATHLLVSASFYTIVLLTGGETARGFTIAATMLGGIAIIAILTCYRATGRLEREAPASRAAPLRFAFRDISRDRAFLILFFGIIVSGGFGTIQIGALAYVAKYWLGQPGAARELFTAQAIAAILSTPLWARFSRRFGKRETWIAGSLISAASLAIGYALHPETVIGIGAAYVGAQIGYTSFIIVMFAMTADVADWGEMRTGRRHEGVVFGAIAFGNKLAAGMTTTLLGALLGVIGISATTKAGAAATGTFSRDGLLATALLLPAGGYIVSALLVIAYPITRSAHEAARGRLATARLEA